MSNGKSGKAAEVVLLKEEDEAPWQEHNGDVYRCPVYLIPEETGGFSVVAPTLPGAVSQGESEGEALANITEALVGVISVYKERGGTIPWKDMPPVPEPGTITRWVFVHV